MLSQLLFGEYYIVEEILEKWIKISTVFDQFSGWIDRKFFQEADVKKELQILLESVLYSRISEIGMPDGSTQLIPAGCNLPNYQEAKPEFTLGKQKYSVRSLTGELLLPPGQKIFETALRLCMHPIYGAEEQFSDLTAPVSCKRFLRYTGIPFRGIPATRYWQVMLFPG